MSIVSLSEAIEKRSGPDPDCVSIGVQNGRPDKQYRYAMAYKMNGREYSFDIWARDWAEAEEHCRAIRGGAEVAAQIVREGDWRV